MKPRYLIPALAMALTSCGDFLELQPLNEVVLENYWKEKDDVQSVVYSCYSGLTTTNCTQRMFVWGEVRSDNVQEGASSDQNLRLVTQEELLTSSPWTNWVDFYQVINRCNTVIKYAPVVAESDPNYTDGDMRAHIAEVTTLRALCYFYLVRAFRDVPYITTPSSDDSNIEERYRVPATNMYTILYMLAADLESVRGDAIKRYPKNQEDFNTARITRAAVDALLCDIYLWLGDYQKCMDAADRIIAYKTEIYEELVAEDENDLEIELYDDLYPLIPELISGNTLGKAYNSIFGKGYSFENIFELGFEENKGNENKLVSEFFGSSENSQGKLFANYKMAEVLNSTDKYDAAKLFSYDDARYAEYMANPSEGTYTIRKYCYQTCNVETGSTSNPKFKVSSGTRSVNDANWIIYRLTDVMLMKAEAAVELQAQQGGDSLLNVAFGLVKSINRRARNLSEADNRNLKQASFATTNQMRELVMDERRRELLFEGKRWFDMVRYALRWNDNTTLINQVCTKTIDKPDAVRVKLASQDALFWPINKSELIVNPNLKQNPAYQTDDDEN